MEKIILNCETVTPLLMHGYDGKTPELREQSFKGVMRFWFRAIHGNLDLKELREKEAEIFGDKQKKSSFRMKIYRKNLNDKDFKLLLYKDEIEAEIKKENPTIKEKDLEQKLKKYKKTKSKGFNPNQTFEIEFIGKNLEVVENIFILSTILGGFGQRSRRGFGSIKINNINNEVFNFTYSKEEIIKLIKKINPEFTTNDNDENFKSKGKYPYIKSITIVENSYIDYNILTRKIGLATHKFACFGSANPRLASPVYVTINKNDNQYFPIIISLNGRGCWKNFNDFKKEIL